MLLSYILALLSKESSLILPVLLALYHYSFKKKVKVKEFFSIGSLAVIYILLRITILKALLANRSYTTNLFQRLPGFFVAITNYVKLLFFPFNLHMEYRLRVFNAGDLKVILGAVILLVLLVYAFRRRESNKLVFFSILWFFVALLPVSNLYPINAYMAEHWLYLPSIGFFLLAAKAISFFYKVERFKVFTKVFVVSSLVFYSYLTIRQNIFWREPIAFYEYTLKYAPDSPRVHYNLGNTYNDIDKREESVAAYKKAIEMKANYTEAYSNLGSVYTDMGKNEEAVAVYKKAVEIKADHADVHYNLGAAYMNMNKTEKAIAAYKKAIEIKDDHKKLYYIKMLHKQVVRFSKKVGING